jgi:hypothetical protein
MVFPGDWSAYDLRKIGNRKHTVIVKPASVFSLSFSSNAIKVEFWPSPILNSDRYSLTKIHLTSAQEAPPLEKLTIGTLSII